MTTAFTEAEHPRAHGGQFTDKRNTAPAGGLTPTTIDLTTQTPVEVDTELAELYYALSEVQHRTAVQEGEIVRYEKYIAREARFPQRLADYQNVIDRCRVKIAELKAQAAELRIEMAPFEAEYRRRGRWTRAFLVTGGHLHNSMSCSTCNRDGKSTQFAWMTDYSGADETTIVEAASDRACTVCFPSAPVAVLNRPSKLFTPDEKQAAAERAERQEKRAAAAATKAAKAIANPDGTPLRHGYRDARSLVTAERELVDALHDIALDDLRPFGNREYAGERTEWRDKLVSAIAHKRDIPEDQVLEEYGVKATKKLTATKKAWGIN